GRREFRCENPSQLDRPRGYFSCSYRGNGYVCTSASHGPGDPRQWRIPEAEKGPLCVVRYRKREGFLARKAHAGKLARPCSCQRRTGNDKRQTRILREPYQSIYLVI